MPSIDRRPEVKHYKTTAPTGATLLSPLHDMTTPIGTRIIGIYKIKNHSEKHHAK